MLEAFSYVAGPIAWNIRSAPTLSN